MSETSGTLYRPKSVSQFSLGESIAFILTWILAENASPKVSDLSAVTIMHTANLLSQHM